MTTMCSPVAYVEDDDAGGGGAGGAGGNAGGAKPNADVPGAAAPPCPYNDLRDDIRQESDRLIKTMDSFRFALDGIGFPEEVKECACDGAAFMERAYTFARDGVPPKQLLKNGDAAARSIRNATEAIQEGIEASKRIDAAIKEAVIACGVFNDNAEEACMSAEFGPDPYDEYDGCGAGGGDRK